MVEIKKNTECDTRTAKSLITKEVLDKCNRMHIQDVSNLMNEFARMIIDAGQRHDWTKVEFEQEELECMQRTQTTGSNFVDDVWFKRHIATERHHLKDRIPNDVDLVDVLEMICDCITAGLARSGEYRDDYGGRSFDVDLLKLAYKNTINKLLKLCVVV